MRQTSRNNGDPRAYPTRSLQSKGILQSELASTVTIAIDKNDPHATLAITKAAVERYYSKHMSAQPVPSPSQARRPTQICIDRGPGSTSGFIAKVIRTASAHNVTWKAAVEMLRKRDARMRELITLEQPFIAPPHLTLHSAKLTVLAQALDQSYPRPPFATRILRVFADKNHPCYEGQ